MVSNFSPLNREQTIHELRTEAFDLLIIGGGITGAGVARDASSRGMKVALVEANDFAFGTSSRSSKLIHGGIRYLENLEFGLVFEALSERSLLFDLAPHMVHPLRFLIPMYKKSRVSMFKMGLGMILYDLLALFESPELHERLSKEQIKGRCPSLGENELVGGYAYSDAYMDDDRLVIETLRSAISMGAKCQSYIKATSDFHEQEGQPGVEVEDVLTGEKFFIRCRHVVSSVGPWTDQVGQLMDKSWKPILRPTKGVHLTFSRERVPLKHAVVMALEERIVFAIPRNEMVIIGTTDTDFTGDPKDVRVNQEDVDYILGVSKKYFSDLDLSKEDILGCYAGVRPLVDDGSSAEGTTSREHSIWSHSKRVTFVCGGKYTTYRLMAEHTVDHVLGNFSSDRIYSFLKSDTRKALNPEVTTDKFLRAQLEIPEKAKRYNIPEEIMTLAVSRHGAEANKLFQYKLPTGYEEPWRDYWCREAIFAIQEANCYFLRDFYWRRAPLFLAEADHGLQYLDAISETFAKTLGWDESKKAEQIQDLKSQIEKEMNWL